MKGLIDCVVSNLNIDLLHTGVQGAAWILMQTGASTTGDFEFYFLITFVLSVMHWNATYGGQFQKNEQWGYLAAGLSFTAALLWTLNLPAISDGNTTACLIMLWASFGLYAYDIVKVFVDAE